MTSIKLRQEFLNFFEKKEHKIVPSSSLLPADPTVLFTTAGMQQFKPYYLGEKSPYGLNVVSCQKCFRTSDIEEVGDQSHLTFIEMLGNFSFGGYFKEEAIKFAYELLISNFQLPISNLKVTVFGGDKEVSRDEESVKIWDKLGFSENKGNLSFVGREENFWGPTGEEGPCGPTTEIYFKNLELWNLVFNEYYQDRKRSLAPLEQKGVDTGMGLERLAMVVQNKPSVYETDLFEPIIKEIHEQKKYRGLTCVNLRSQRIIADHIKGAVFLISEGIFPSNVEQGYVLRRVLRKAIRYGKLLNLPRNFLIPLAQKVIEIYQDEYREVKSKETDILTVIQNEEEKFEKTLSQGLKQFEKITKAGDISGIDAFHLFDTYGFPLELTEELAKEKNITVDIKGFQEAFEKHREISRAGVKAKFGGIGKEATYEATRLHTATHLLHSALREILGSHVQQMGSDITPQRLRFDFSHSQKMTEEEIKKVEDLVNQKIKEDLEVKREEMDYQEAIKAGALAFFKEKYPEIVSVYSIDNFSKEICAGPHLRRTSELGIFKIIKEESCGAGIRRIRAILK
ncbi:MAG: alanine--tRNA ligase [Candidatus Nealsonbacteria bacterium CG_4_10_14_0_2_um_filter_37_10]|uniref:Alanine--tRNA ligase n=1 Tax=Candidatus Nealsonbacteria bacterium CG_4_10_14_0_2_um_filter_37_10 TaxID=1974679 RepID=A0A2M7V061_9BACT|nr:MAG: alanine--tRNA ligase [Candidatus Nealsonbacteria bacterium CG_4_10_14_0_2_um_filter_37_10]